MMKRYCPLLLGAAVLISSCNAPTSSEQSNEINEQAEAKKEVTVEYSFAFVGCNRVQRGDQANTAATNSSSANVAALKRIFKEVCAENRKPELFFFLGDLVYAESTLERLDTQLNAWVEQFKDPSFSPIASSGIEMVAVPGNHEMLYWADHNVQGHDEWPLKGATEIWMNYMRPYMPKDRDTVAGPTSQVNQMTFSFVRDGIGFVVMNTDTYNDSTMYGIPNIGMEGLVPTKWITEKIKEYQGRADVEHIFVLGHKPYYVDGAPNTGHGGLPEGPELWPVLDSTNTVAMLSAHLHDYQRVQPGDSGAYQIIAGNGGSEGTATFFGYSTVNILSNGEVQLISKGFDVGNPYYIAMPDSPTTVRDSTILSWTKNANPYKNNF